MKRVYLLLAFAFALLIAMAAYIVSTPQGPVPPAPSYLPEVDQR